MRMLDALNRSSSTRKRRLAAPLVLGALAALCLATVLPAAVTAQDQPSALMDVMAGGKRARDIRTIQEHMDAWLTFTKDITAIASADDKIISVPKDSVTSRKVRLLPIAVGRTVLTVTYGDGTNEQLLFTVKKDVSVLEAALATVHPSITVDVAPDRDAIVLNGQVPTIAVSEQAEQVARQYLEAGAKGAAPMGGKDASGVLIHDNSQGGTQFSARGSVINLIRIQALPTSLESRLKTELDLAAGPGLSIRRIQQGNAPDDARDVFVLSGTANGNESIRRAVGLVRAAVNDNDPSKSRVVVHVDNTDVSASIESVIEQAIHEQLKATKVKVSRVGQFDSTGDTDVLVLTGSVPNQTALVQTLMLTSKIFQQQEIVKRKRAGEDKKTTEITANGSTIVTETTQLRVDEASKDIKAIADESGALRSNTRGLGRSGDSALRSVFSAGSQSSSAGSGFDNLLDNMLDTNLARAKAIELADGRIVSFLVVDDLPQVRVDIKVYEVNRTALLDWDSNLNKLGAADFDTNGVDPNRVARRADGSILTNADGDPVLGSTGTDISGVVSFLEGGFGQRFQVGGGRFAIDAAFNLLESEGIARAIASPSLTVLSGEMAAFGDGGSVSVRSSVSTNVGINNNAGVFSTVEKLTFGIQLAVRPLVDEHGYITLDVVPSVSNPDFELTQLVRTSTGTPQETVAFAERSMRTSARLRDGETLLIGGLTDRSRQDKSSETPGLAKIPIVGWLFHDKSYQDKDRELVISVNPSIVREVPRQARLWAYPSAGELMPRAARKQASGEARVDGAKSNDANAKATNAGSPKNAGNPMNAGNSEQQ